MSIIEKVYGARTPGDRTPAGLQADPQWSCRQYPLPPSAPRLSDEFLRLCHRKLTSPETPGTSPDRSPGERVEALLGGIPRDADFQALPSFEEDLLEIQRDPVAFRDLMVKNVLALGPLGLLLDDPAVDQIVVNGPWSISYVKAGTRLEGGRFLDGDHLGAVVRRLLAADGRSLKEIAPLGDVCLRSGAVATFALPPVTADGTLLVIRRARKHSPSLAELVARDVLSHTASQFLTCCVRARMNIVILGGARSGKTLLMNALMLLIPEEERVVVVEDMPELSLESTRWIRLRARGTNRTGLATSRDILRAGRAMAPDRLVLGECKGGEAVDVILAMASGTDGFMTTMRAPGTQELLGRLVALGQLSGDGLSDAILLRQIAMGLQVLVRMERGASGAMQVVRITAAGSTTEGKLSFTDVYARRAVAGETRPQLVPTGLVPGFHGRLEEWCGKLPPEFYNPP